MNEYQKLHKTNQTSSYVFVWSKSPNCNYILGIARLRVELVSITLQNSKSQKSSVSKKY